MVHLILQELGIQQRLGAVYHLLKAKAFVKN